MTRTGLSKVGVTAVALVLMSTMYAVEARAQTAAQVAQQYDVPNYYGRGKNVSVLERDRPEYDALGVQTGGFTLYPVLNTGVTYDDNVYATQTNEKGDAYATIEPVLVAQSNWGRHGLRLTADVKNEDYYQDTSENELAYALRADGLINVYGDSTVNLGASAAQQYEPRGNIYSTTGAENPVHYQTYDAYARGQYQQDRFRFTVGGDYSQTNYTDVAQIGGGLIPENTRNENTWNVSGRTDYAFSPDTAVFAKVNYAAINYEITTPSTDRSSKDVMVTGGVNFDLTSLARGEIGVGYFSRQYNIKSFSSLSGVAVDAKIEYFPTQVLTFTLAGNRQPQDAAFNTSGGFFQNLGSVTADYEVRRNWIVSGMVGYEYDEFQGLSRHDEVTNVLVSSKYFISRNVGINAHVTYSDRSSSGLFQGPSYKDVTVGASLTFQL